MQPSVNANRKAVRCKRSTKLLVLLAGASALSGVATAQVLAAGPAVVPTAAATAPPAATVAAPTIATAPAPAPTACNAKRPAINFNRWAENWDVLASPCLPRQPLDGLKYIPFGNGSSYLSLGAGLRERYEHIDAPSYGAGAHRPTAT